MRHLIVAMILALATITGCKNREGATAETPRASTPTPTPTPTPVPAPEPKPDSGYHYEVPGELRILAAADTLSLEGSNIHVTTRTIQAATAAKDVADSEHADFTPDATCSASEVREIKIRGTEAHAFSEQCPDREARRFVYFQLAPNRIAAVLCNISLPPGASKCDEFLDTIRVDMKAPDAWRAVIAYTEDPDATTEDWNDYGNDIAEACKAAGADFAWASPKALSIPVHSGEKVVATLDVSRPVMGWDKSWLLVSPGPTFVRLDYDPANVDRAKAFCRGD